MKKIYTKTGDNGVTGMLGGKRVSKSCLEMEAIGEVDELNANLGLMIAELEMVCGCGDEGCEHDEDPFKEARTKLLEIQNNLFVIGSNLAALQTPLIKIPKLEKENITKLEKWIDKMERDLPELKNFILPGGDVGAAQSYLARAVCRRAERVVIKLNEKFTGLPRSERSSTTGVPVEIIKYLNRLSDCLFVLARWINWKTGEKEVKWMK
jgi:cob(I)alamin adenosyltransferase